MKIPARKVLPRKPAEPDGWKPVLNGPIFCAPLCGRGCTKAEHDKAVENAAKLAKSLGPTWKPQVWENLGWHHCAVSPCGRLKVHPRLVKGSNCCAYLDHEGDSGGLWVARATTARAAVRAVVKQAEDEARRILATFWAVKPLVK